MSNPLCPTGKVANAERWCELCDKQISVLTQLKARFPERAHQLAEITGHWAEIRDALKRNGTAG